MLPEDIKDKTILIAPLDWGMGHLTRCLPLIHVFLKNECKIIFAGTTFQCEWVKRECPNIITEEVEGYQIRLDSDKSTYRQMLTQTSKMLYAIKAEKEVAQKLSEKYSVDTIVSDNRYGFRTPKTQSIFITHQLAPPVPKLRTLVTKKILNWVNEFDECWIQDEEQGALCPELNKSELNIPKSFIGWSSRFSKVASPILNKYTFIASGPEPQLSKFSQEIAKIVERTGKNYQLVVPKDLGLKNQVVNPSTEELNKIINASEIIVSRAGYTSIMELSVVGKKAILVPTPGQYEQSYLAQSVQHPQIQFVQEKDLDQFFTSFAD